MKTIHQIVKATGSSYSAVIISMKLLDLRGRQTDRFSDRVWTPEEVAKITALIQKSK